MLIYDINILHWTKAREARDEINYRSYKAKNWWIWNLKKMKALLTYAVTKFITHISSTFKARFPEEPNCIPQKKSL